MIETLGRPRFMLALEWAVLLLMSALLYGIHGGGLIALYPLALGS